VTLLEEKLIAGLLVLAGIFLGTVILFDHLIDVGKADEKAAVFAQEQKDEEKAAAQTADWQSQLTNAQTARQGEIDAAKDESLKPISVVSLQHYALSPSVPASTSPAASSSSAASGPVCSGLVPGSPAEMRSFNDAQSADQLIADYRDLYNSWPMIPTATSR
jgi:hypothetical protein